MYQSSTTQNYISYKDFSQWHLLTNGEMGNESIICWKHNFTVSLTSIVDNNHRFKTSKSVIQWIIFVEKCVNVVQSD